MTKPAVIFVDLKGNLVTSVEDMRTAAMVQDVRRLINDLLAAGIKFQVKYE
jgi:hypothetical protein